MNNNVMRVCVYGDILWDKSLLTLKFFQAHAADAGADLCAAARPRRGCPGVAWWVGVFVLAVVR